MNEDDVTVEYNVGEGLWKIRRDGELVEEVRTQEAAMAIFFEEKGDTKRYLQWRNKCEDRCTLVLKIQEIEREKLRSRSER